MKHMHKKQSNKLQLLFNLAGWYGAMATLSAYMLISFEVLKPIDLTYQFLNLSGAIGLGLICYYKRTYQPLFVNIVWGVIAILAIANIVMYINN
jgi:fluoride ion exporter CrcB/FEX